MIQYVPLFSAFCYPVAALLLKRSIHLGAGDWRTVYVSNLAMAVCLVPLWAFGGKIFTELWYEPLLAGLAFFVGQLFTFLAISRGDVSIATPVMGIKAILTAFFTVWLFKYPLSWQLWAGAGMTAIALSLLGGGKQTGHHHLFLTITYAVLSAAAFALTDTLVSFWAKGWGIGRFLPLMFGSVVVYSLSFIPFFEGRLKAIPRIALPWLISGSFLLALQALGIALTLTLYGHATETNILYNSRGIWSVVIVWVGGHLFHSAEQHLGRKTLIRRLAGSVLLLFAIVLIISR